MRGGGTGFPNGEAVQDAYALVQKQAALVADAEEQLVTLKKQVEYPEEADKSGEELQAELEACERTVHERNAELTRLRGSALIAWSASASLAMQGDVAMRRSAFSHELLHTEEVLAQRFDSVPEEPSKPLTSPGGGMGWSVSLSGHALPHAPRSPLPSPRSSRRHSPRTSPFPGDGGTASLSSSYYSNNGRDSPSHAPSTLPSLPSATFDPIHSRAAMSSLHGGGSGVRIGASYASENNLLTTPRSMLGGSSGGLSPMRSSSPSTRAGGLRNSLGSSSLSSAGSMIGSLTSGRPEGRRLSPLADALHAHGPVTYEAYEAVQSAYLGWKALLATSSKHANRSRVPKPSLLRRAPSIRAQPGMASATYVNYSPGVGPLKLFSPSPRLDDPLGTPQPMLPFDGRTSFKHGGA